MKTPLSDSARNGAFTALELLVVAAIVVVLVAFTFAVSGEVSKSANSAKCVSNLKQIGAATAQYVSEHRGLLPHYPPVSADGSLGYATVGAWYWHLAPYLEVPRHPTAGSSLGALGSSGLAKPVVFTCPAQQEEGDVDNFKKYFTYPSLRPVSYAPSTRTEGKTPYPQGDDPTRYTTPLQIQQVQRASQKIWISDSRVAEALNVSSTRWAANYSSKDAWPRWSFSRHRGGGNALFFDGHVERVPLTAITEGNLDSNLRHYFYPLLDE